MRKVLLGSMAAAFVATSAMAADVSCTAKKMVIVDKLTAASKAKLVYVNKDQTCGITKGTGTDPADIDAALEYSSPTLGSSGSAVMPQGSGWLVNKESVAKYVNKEAPTGGAVKVAVIKPGKLLKAVLKSLGDSPIDVYQGGSTANPVDVSTVYAINNGAESFRFCSDATGCVRKIIGGGTGAKVVCKGWGPGTCPTSPSGAF